MSALFAGLGTVFGAALLPLGVLLVCAVGLVIARHMRDFQK